VVFAGTPEFAVPSLRACLMDADVVAVYTQPDRPAGRSRELKPSPIKQVARRAGVAIEQPASLTALEVQQRLRAYAPDLLVAVAYGLILPRAVLAIPELGCWNAHASLLPRWRGAAPIARAILAGDTETGVCLMRMQAGLDTGPVLLCESTAIGADDTAGTLHDRLAAIAACLLRAGLRRVAGAGGLPETPQAEAGICYAKKLDKAEASLDFTQSAVQLERQVRAFDPWPVAEATLAGERVRVWRAEARNWEPGAGDRVQPGEIVAASKAGIDVACGEGLLRIGVLQRAGGRKVSAGDYVNGRPDLRR
jgi:methionyl-tRNA formyltransferase